MTTAARCRVISAAPITVPLEAEVDSRTRALLYGAILPTLLRLAWPNILVMLAQASTGLIETWWVSHLGTDALAGMALVFPVVMLMQMVSAGAMGGGISSAVARALGADRRVRVPLPSCGKDKQAEVIPKSNNSGAARYKNDASFMCWPSSLLSVFFLEPIDATSSIGNALFASEEWM